VYAAVQNVGIFVSTDGGVTFPASGNLFANSGAPASPGSIVFAQSTVPDNQTFYASVITSSGNSIGLFKSSTGGKSWSPITLGTEVVAQLQGNYVQTVGCDPQTNTYVYFGLRSLFLATDGGASGIYDQTQNSSEPHNNRIDLYKVHADQHALVFSPPTHVPGGAYIAGRRTPVYNGTDGGIATTADAGANWNVINNGIGTVLLNQIDIGRGSTPNNAYTYGAAQDQGISQHRLAPSDPDFAGNNWC
jgi:hypothetical protein